MSDDNPKPEKPRPSDDLTAAQLIEKHGNKSAAIRALHGQDYTVSEIAKKVGVIYQHARNVVLRPLKRNNDNPEEGTNDVK